MISLGVGMEPQGSTEPPGGWQRQQPTSLGRSWHVFGVRRPKLVPFLVGQNGAEMDG